MLLFIDWDPNTALTADLQQCAVGWHAYHSSHSVIINTGACSPSQYMSSSSTGGHNDTNVPIQVCSGMGYLEGSRCQCYPGNGMTGSICDIYYGNSNAYPVYLFYKYLSLIIWWSLSVISIWRLIVVSRAKFQLARLRMHHTPNAKQSLWAYIDAQVLPVLRLSSVH
jgi:hypothetical protein